MDAAISRLIKTLGRELEASAADFEDAHSADHATSQAHYAAAEAIRRVAGVIGYVLIGTEDFSQAADDPEARLNEIRNKAAGWGDMDADETLEFIQAIAHGESIE